MASVSPPRPIRYPEGMADAKTPDWKALAAARRLDIPEADLDRITAPLDGLERAFRPLTATIPHDVEPAIIFHAAEEAQ